MSYNIRNTHDEPFFELDNSSLGQKPLRMAGNKINQVNVDSADETEEDHGYDYSSADETQSGSKIKRRPGETKQ